MTGTFLLAKRSNLPREYASTRERLPRGVSRAGAIRVSQNSVPHPAKHARKRLTQMQAGGRGCTRMGHRPSQYRGLPGSTGHLSSERPPWARTRHRSSARIRLDMRNDALLCRSPHCPTRRRHPRDRHRRIKMLPAYLQRPRGGHGLLPRSASNTPS
jgi:hypothetical protein